MSPATRKYFSRSVPDTLVIGTYDGFDITLTWHGHKKSKVSDERRMMAVIGIRFPKGFPADVSPGEAFRRRSAVKEALAFWCGERLRVPLGGSFKLENEWTWQVELERN